MNPSDRSEGRAGAGHRAWGLSRSLLIALAASALVLLATTLLLLAVEKRTSEAAPEYSAARLGGMEYEVMGGRPIHPSNAIDRRIVAGLPARDLRTRHGKILFGAFIDVTNHATRPLPSAEGIELRDEHNHVYRPLPLPASNPYAYSPRLLRPRTRIPVQGSRADDNLAATGMLVLFRIPVREYNSGTLELDIHDPVHRGAAISLGI